MWVTLSNVCGSKVFECNTMTAQLYLVEVFYLRQKKYDCKIIFSWTVCKSKLNQQFKIKNVCVFLTLTKSMSETKLG